MSRVLIACLAAAAFCAAGCEGRSSREPGASEKAPPPEERGIPLIAGPDRAFAPEIRGTSLEGGAWSLHERRGKVVVIDFWATWCAPCRMTIPHMVEIANELGPRGVEVVGISLDRGGKDLVASFSRQMGIRYPILLDSEGRLASALGGVEAIPTFFLVDRQGKLAARVRGAVPKELLRGAVESLLAEG